MIEIPFTKESRLDLINLAISKVNADSYLEIGCFKDKIFSKIHVAHKIGVDPERGGNCRMTSDEFFKKNTDKFDVVFIDGLHHYDQVSRDFENSLKSLNSNGIIRLVTDANGNLTGSTSIPGGSFTNLFVINK
jgi:predicted O-methyltransferase YrrM